jgi:hypothetical protein
MSNESFPTKSVSNTDHIEERSRQILRAKLPLNDAILVFYSDKYPNLDGHIEFLEGENGSTAVKLFFQLKGTEQDINYYDLDVSLLNYCYRAAEPTFLILVNIPQEKVYWVHINKSYISSVLQIEDLSKFSQQQKRIIFQEDKTIDQNAPVLMGVCEKHNKEPSIDALGSLLEDQVGSSVKELSLPGAESKSVEFSIVKSKFEKSISNLDENLMLYHAFIYALRPFYLDKRGEKKRKDLLNLLSISDAQERFIIENLLLSELLAKTGELVYVTDRADAIATLNHFVESGHINLDQVTQLFSEYEQN